MAEIIARFSDGRLLVQEERAIETRYVSGGIPFRIGLFKTVEKVLSIDAHLSGYPELRFAAPLKEVLVSGDTIIPILRRADFYGFLSGSPASGYAGVGGLSGISGRAYMEQLRSGGPTSGIINIKANVIGY